MIDRFKSRIFLAVQAVILIAAVGVVPARVHRLRPEATFPELRSEPLTVGPLYDCPEIVSDAELQRVLQKLQPSVGAQPRVNHVEHALRMWGTDAEFDDEAYLSGAAMRELLVDHQRFAQAWGSAARPLLLNDDTGVRVRVEQHAAASSHVDHTIASLAEVGTPLDHPVLTPAGRMDFRSMIEASLRNFSLNQVEHEWSGLTYALVLTPGENWRTAEGQEITFDRLAERSMRQELQQGVCYGKHRLHELVILLRVDEEQKILSAAVRNNIVDHLKSAVQTLVRTQHADGYWDGQWSGVASQTPEQNLPNGELSERIIVTGHALEWLALAPIEIQPPPEVRIRAGRWLVGTIRAMDSETVRANFPFLTHAGRALALWRGQTPAQSLRRVEN
jgi:hypothetical protein